MTLLLLAGMVNAAELEAPTEVPLPTTEELRPSRDTGSSSGSGGGGKKKNNNGGDGATFKKGKLWGWTYRPYVAPGGGLSIGDGGTSVTGAVDVGVRYWKTKWRGDLSVGGSYTTGEILNGYDLHGGTEFGRREKWWGLSAGVIVFYNGYVSKDEKKSLDPSAGLDIPVELTLGPKKYYVFGGITPSFLFNEDRRVKTLPFGDELEWGVGAGLKLKWINAEVGFNQRITKIGTINTPTLNLSVSGLD